MFQVKVVENIITYISYSIICFRKSCRLSGNVKKYGRARQATDNIIRRMHFACRINKAKTYKLIVNILLFCDKNGYANASQCHVIRCLVNCDIPLCLIGDLQMSTIYSIWHKYAL
jgi:hypothetical protein